LIQVERGRTIHVERFHQTPFVFEEPKPSYFQLDYSERQALLLLGPLAPSRLAHIERVFVVYQPLSKTQVAVAHRLDVPHYQATALQIQASTFPYSSSIGTKRTMPVFQQILSIQAAIIPLMSSVSFKLLTSMGLDNASSSGS
jgi:hypothetical protein